MKNSASSIDSALSRELLVFLVTLYEFRHLGRTAKRLSISLPKASRLLSDARIVFDDPLYVRFGQGLAPTARAHEVTTEIRGILDGMNRLFVRPEFDPSSMTRVFRICCLDNAVPIMIEPMLGLFLRRAPHAGISLIRHDEQTFLRLRSGEADLALFPAVGLPGDFMSTPLLRTPYVHVVRAGHPLEEVLAKRPLTQNDLRRFRRIQICVHPDTDTTEEGVPGPASVPMTAGQTMLWTDYWLGAVRIMHRTDAVLTLPWRTAAALAEDAPLVVLGQARSVPWLEPSLVWHARTAMDVPLEWLRSIFLSTLTGGKPVSLDVIRTGRLDPS